jgi:hypothetical protein
MYHLATLIRSRRMFSCRIFTYRIFFLAQAATSRAQSVSAMYVCMYVCMYGWMDGWMDVWMCEPMCV